VVSSAAQRRPAQQRVRAWPVGCSPLRHCPDVLRASLGACACAAVRALWPWVKVDGPWRSPCARCDWPCAPPSVERGPTVAEAGDSQLSQRARRSLLPNFFTPAVPVPVPVPVSVAAAVLFAGARARLHSCHREDYFSHAGPLTTADTAGCPPSAVPEFLPRTRRRPPRGPVAASAATPTPPPCPPAPWTRQERTQSRPPTRTMSSIRARGAGR
jgi:hypothetical protein